MRPPCFSAGRRPSSNATYFFFTARFLKADCKFLCFSLVLAMSINPEVSISNR